MKILELLERSSASPEFAASLHRFLSENRANDDIEFPPGSPPVKIERTLTKILESYPTVQIRRVRIEGRSGCEYFRGKASVHCQEQERRVTFHWDCRWKAEQMGWKDYFGYPDQIRAAREFGHDCFRIWEEGEAMSEAAAKAAV